MGYFERHYWRLWTCNLLTWRALQMRKLGAQQWLKIQYSAWLWSDSSTPFAVGGSVGTRMWQHCLMQSVCLTPWEPLEWSIALCAAVTLQVPIYNTPNFHNAQVASPATEPSCRTHKLKTWVILAFLSQWAAWKECSALHKFPPHPLARLCFVSRDNVFC